MTFAEGPYRERSDVPVEPAPLAAPRPIIPVDAPIVGAPIVAAAAPETRRQIRTSSASAYAPDAIVTAIVGLVLLITGLIAVARAGINSPLSDPVVSVLGFTHTATLGLVEAGLGLCLLASGAARSRSAALFFGLVLGVAGFVGAVQTSSFRTSLALESAMAWLCVAAAAVVILATLLLPRFVRRTTVVEHV
jgi:hypothetical protein